jgi:hypothetical protein
MLRSAFAIVNAKLCIDSRTSKHRRLLRGFLDPAETERRARSHLVRSPAVFTPVPRGLLAYRWDLDKTYLRTEFDTVRDWLRLAFETAEDKRTVPGAAALLRELTETHPRGIYIVSGSPTQLRKVLEAKLRLDGVRWDALVLKPQLRNILRGRFRFIKDQVGYKLAALFESRATLEPNVLEYMFGDDAELDATIYSLYSDVCTGRVSLDVLREVLTHSGAYEDVVPAVVALAEKVPRGGGALRVFIHLDRVSAPVDFAGPRGPRRAFPQLPPAGAGVARGGRDRSHRGLPGRERAPRRARLHRGRADRELLRPSVAEASSAPGAARSLAAFVDSVDDPVLGVGDAPQLRAFSEGLRREGAFELPETSRAEPEAIDYLEHFLKDKARAKAAKRPRDGTLTFFRQGASSGGVGAGARRRRRLRSSAACRSRSSGAALIISVPARKSVTSSTWNHAA